MDPHIYIFNISKSGQAELPGEEKRRIVSCSSFASTAEYVLVTTVHTRKYTLPATCRIPFQKEIQTAVEVHHISSWNGAVLRVVAMC